MYIALAILVMLGVSTLAGFVIGSVARFGAGEDEEDAEDFA